MAEKPEKGVRYFLSRAACSNEYNNTNAVLVEVRRTTLWHLYRAYVKLFRQQPFKDDALSYLTFMSSCATFVELDTDKMPNMAGLAPYIEGDEQLVEVPYDTFQMLVKRTENNIVRTDGEYILVDDRGVHWEAYDHYGSDSYETEKFYWTDLGIKRKRKGK
jgi:hypothetical protein